MVQNTADSNEVRQPLTYLFNNNEAFPMAGYTGQPEFELYERESYNVSNDKDLPQLTFTSNIGVDELYPQHNENTLNYQLLHPELERWALFRSLPPLLKYEKALTQTMQDIENGLKVVPKYTQIINPPTLLTYYLTLPTWVREHQAITNVFYAMEYHQTRTDIR